MTSTEHILRAQSTYEKLAEALYHQKMLVVDDSPDDVLLLQRKVKVPVEWNVAYCVEEAIALLEHNSYFLVWIDLAMPGQGGSVLVEWMSQQPHYLRRVVCTGSVKSDELEKSLKHGPLALMSKDFTTEHFLQLLYLLNMPVPEYAIA